MRNGHLSVRVAANHHAAVVDAGNRDAKGIGNIDVGDFAAAIEKPMSVEVLVVPVADGFSLVVDAKRVRGFGGGKIDGGDVNCVRVYLATRARMHI